MTIIWKVEIDGVIYEIELPEGSTKEEAQKLAFSKAGISQEEKAPEEKSALGFATNVVTSTGELIKDAATGVLGLSPVTMEEPFSPELRVPPTIEGLAKLIAGIASKAIPGEQGYEQHADALAQMYADRYGSIEKAIETAYNDPAGVAADLSVAAGGAGLVAKGAGLSKVASGLSKVAAATDPVQGIVQGARAAKQYGVINRMDPKGRYKRALGSQGTSKEAIASLDKAAQAGIEEGIVLTKGADEIAKTVLEEIQKSIDDAIEKGMKAGQEIDIRDAIKRMDNAYEMARTGDLPVTVTKALDKIRDTRIEQSGTAWGLPKKLTMEEAQKLKKSMGEAYDLARKSTNKSWKTQVTTQALDDIRRGLKEEIEEFFPEVADWNRRMGNLIDYKKVAEKQLQKLMNTRSFGLEGTTKGIMGGMISEGGVLSRASGALIAIITGNLLKDPTIRSKLAIAIHKAQKRGVKPSGRMIKGATPSARIKAFEDYLATYLDTSEGEDATEEIHIYPGLEAPASP